MPAFNTAQMSQDDYIADLACVTPLAGSSTSDTKAKIVFVVLSKRRVTSFAVRCVSTAQECWRWTLQRSAGHSPCNFARQAAMLHFIITTGATVGHAAQQSSAPEKRSIAVQLPPGRACWLHDLRANSIFCSLSHYAPGHEGVRALGDDGPTSNDKMQAWKMLGLQAGLSWPRQISSIARLSFYGGCQAVEICLAS